MVNIVLLCHGHIVGGGHFEHPFIFIFDQTNIKNKQPGLNIDRPVSGNSPIEYPFRLNTVCHNLLTVRIILSYYRLEYGITMMIILIATR